MTLKEFKNLEVTGAEAALAKFTATASARAAGGWTRIEDLEKRLPEPNGMTCFACVEAPGRPAATLWISSHDVGRLRVTNIVPRTKSRLSYDEYNAILDDFVHHVAEPVARSLGLSLTTTGGTFLIEKHLSERTLKALRSFSIGANKATGSAHPSDEERWFSFVVSAHRENAQLGATDLERWLRSEGWDNDQASKLMEEYEQYRELLRFYDVFDDS